jgi:putative CocE/NonD family hydrolase
MRAFFVAVSGVAVLACKPGLSTVSADALICRAAGEADFAPAARRVEAPTGELEGAEWVAANYDKQEVRIPMRDGKTLFTSIYSPKRRGEEDTRRFPILFKRTPYSVGPYGPEAFAERLGPSELLAESGYIFVYQDVRGRFMSEGEFVNMRPHIAEKKTKDEVDESSDTYDSIEWMLANIEHNNAKVGMWGISYPGFYAAAGMIDAHPALRAVSPQAPIADWFFDDFHHHGAFFLPHAFNFLINFGRKREGLESEWGGRFDHGTPDGYEFFKRLGPLKNANEQYMHGEIAFWNDVVAHPNRDAYWQARDILPHLHNAAPAVMTVGGWFDAEDLYGPLQIYRSVEAKNPDVFNMLVMGPWRHGGWARTDGASLGNVEFGDPTSHFYQEHLEKPFFEHHLKGGPEPELPEAMVFETGSNEWQAFSSWPPPSVERSFHFSADGKLAEAAPLERRAFDEFTSDPEHPVPYSQDINKGMTREYMTDDQRFASRRPDVLVFETEVLREDLTVAGPILAELWVSTSQRDADWIVKVIDVFPDDAVTPEERRDPSIEMGGYQMMVRSEVIRGRFREDYAQPKPFRPNQPTLVKLPLQDVLHSFKKGHRLMVQVQSSWFPLIDRNPQGWVDNIYEAQEGDFVSAQHRVYRDVGHPSRIVLGQLP